jgi:hypothetical protein
MKIIILPAFAILLLTFSACKKEEIIVKKSFSDEVISGKVSNTPTFTLGQQYGGGYIFYIDASNQHGLIVSLENLLGTYSYGTPSPGTIPTYTFNSDGYYNTKRIIQVYGNVPKYARPYAALACKNYTGGGFNDWYLPSYEELAILISAASLDINFTTDYGSFWSSTEDRNDPTAALVLPAYYYSYNEILNFFLVRPIRKF